jgi:hypothetical protein
MNLQHSGIDPEHLLMNLGGSGMNLAHSGIDFAVQRIDPEPQRIDFDLRGIIPALPCIGTEQRRSGSAVLPSNFALQPSNLGH